MRMQTAVECRAHRVHRGEKSEHDAGQHAKKQREREQASVEFGLENRTVRREDGDHDADGQIADDECASTAEYPKQCRFSQQQADDSV